MSAGLAKWGGTGNPLTKDEVKARADEAGVRLSTIPEEGMKDDVAQFLIDRQYQKMRRQDALQNSDATVTKLAGGLAGSLADPLGIAANFIPVIGQARYAAMLGRAGSVAGRLGVRAGVGAAEGAVGAAVLEPINLALADNLGDEYGLTDSAINIAFGTAMGGGLHMGVGAVSDALARGKAPDFAAPQGKLAEKIDKMPAEVRRDALQTAIAQAAEDRPIRVDYVTTAADAQVRAKISTLDAQIRENFQNKELLGALVAERNSLASKLESFSFDEAPAKVKPFTELENPTVVTRETLVPLAEKADGTLDEKALSTHLEQTVNEARAQGLEVRLVSPEGTPRRIVESGKANLIDEVGEKFKIKDLLDKELGYRLEIGKASPDTAHLTAQTPDELLSPLPRGADPKDAERAVRSAVSEPDTRYVDDKLIEEQDAALREFLGSDDPIEAARMDLEQITEEVDLLGKQMGVDLLADKDVIRASDDVKLVEDFSRAVMSMASCRMRKG
jgi:hypothetical protein